MYLRAVVGRQIILYVRLFDETHFGAPVDRAAYLEDARLKRSQECQRRERESRLLLEHTPLRARVPETARDSCAGFELQCHFEAVYTTCVYQSELP